MTVASTNTAELNIDEIVRLGLEYAGQMNDGEATVGVQWNNKSSRARVILETMVMKNLPAEVRLERSIEFYEIAIEAGEKLYELPAGTIDVIGEAKYRVSGETSETVVSKASRSRYHAISDKDAEGVPLKYFAELHSPVTLTLWPVPIQDGTLIIQRQKYLADSKAGSNNIDVEPYWYKYIVYELAHNIAITRSMPEAKCGYLKALAKEQIRLAGIQGSDDSPSEMTNGTITGWSNL